MTDGETRGVFGTLASAIERVPPLVLGLIGLEVVFVLSLTYLFIKQNEARERVLGPLVAACARSVPIEALQMLVRPSE